MQVEDKRDLLFALVAGEGFVNLMAAWALLLLATHGAKSYELIGPGIAFLASAILIVLTCAGADHLRGSSGVTSHSVRSSQRRTR